jgi:hypothetical protein
VGLFLLFALLTSVPAFASHGGVDAIAIDPRSPTTIYATMEPTTVFKSTDGGASWSITALPVNAAQSNSGHVPALVIDPLNPIRLY